MIVWSKELKPRAVDDVACLDGETKWALTGGTLLNVVPAVRSRSNRSGGLPFPSVGTGRQQLIFFLGSGRQQLPTMAGWHGTGIQSASARSARTIGPRTLWSTLVFFLNTGPHQISTSCHLQGHLFRLFFRKNVEKQSLVWKKWQQLACHHFFSSKMPFWISSIKPCAQTLKTDVLAHVWFPSKFLRNVHLSISYELDLYTPYFQTHQQKIRPPLDWRNFVEYDFYRKKFFTILKFAGIESYSCGGILPILHFFFCGAILHIS